MKLSKHAALAITAVVLAVFAATAAAYDDYGYGYGYDDYGKNRHGGHRRRCRKRHGYDAYGYRGVSDYGSDGGYGYTDLYGKGDYYGGKSYDNYGYSGYGDYGDYGKDYFGGDNGGFFGKGYFGSPYGYYNNYPPSYTNDVGFY